MERNGRGSEHKAGANDAARYDSNRAGENREKLEPGESHIKRSGNLSIHFTEINPSAQYHDHGNLQSASMEAIREKAVFWLILIYPIVLMLSIFPRDEI